MNNVATWIEILHPLTRRRNLTKIHVTRLFRMLLSLRLSSKETITHHAFQGKVIYVCKLVTSSRLCR